MGAAVRRLQRTFERVWHWAAARSPRVPPLLLYIGCPEIEDRRRSGDPRALFHVGHIPGFVCTIPEAGLLPDTYLVGLMLHELGHPMAMAAWRRSEQEDADKAVLDFLRIRLRYKGPLLLEWVPPSVARAILRAPAARRRVAVLG